MQNNDPNNFESNVIRVYIIHAMATIKYKKTFYNLDLISRVFAISDMERSIRFWPIQSPQTSSQSSHFCIASHRTFLAPCWDSSSIGQGKDSRRKGRANAFKASSSFVSWGERLSKSKLPGFDWIWENSQSMRISIAFCVIALPSFCNWTIAQRSVHGRR